MTASINEPQIIELTDYDGFADLTVANSSARITLVMSEAALERLASALDVYFRERGYEGRARDLACESPSLGVDPWAGTVLDSTVSSYVDKDGEPCAEWPQESYNGK